MRILRILTFALNTHLKHIRSINTDITSKTFCSKKISKKKTKKPDMSKKAKRHPESPPRQVESSSSGINISKKISPYTEVIKQVIREEETKQVDHCLFYKLSAEGFYRTKFTQQGHMDDLLDLIKTLLKSKHPICHQRNMPNNLRALLIIMNAAPTVLNTTWCPYVTSPVPAVQLTVGNALYATQRDFHLYASITVLQNALLSPRRVMLSRLLNLPPHWSWSRESIFMIAAYINGSKSRFLTLLPILERIGVEKIEEVVTLTKPDRARIQNPTQPLRSKPENKEPPKKRKAPAEPVFEEQEPDELKISSDTEEYFNTEADSDEEN